MRKITDWSIEGAGVLLGLVSMMHFFYDRHWSLTGITEIALPLVVSSGIIVFGRWVYQQSDMFDPYQRLYIALSHLVGGLFFMLVLIWALTIGTLDGSEWPQEALFSILLNGGALGAASTGVMVAVGVRLRSQRDELRERTARLEKLTSIISHDLRNPLTIAQGRVKLAQETGDTSNLDSCLHAFTRIDRIIDEMLTLVQETHTVETTTVVALDSIANTAWEMVETDEVVLHVEESLQFQAEKGQLRQVFENLFRNAIEHGGETVTTVHVGPLDAGGFFIEDDGPGIPEDIRAEVFEWGVTTGEGGTGLGLAIVQEIVTAHGWSITVTESRTGGARFEITGIELWEE